MEETTMGDNGALRVQIPGSLEYIAAARYAVDTVCQQMHLSGNVRAAVKLAVGEACNNAVLHARQAVPGGSPVVIECRQRPDALEIEVTNRGADFCPGAPGVMPPAEALTEQGRGRALMEMLMNSVEYLCENGNTVVRMCKKREDLPPSCDTPARRTTAL